VASTAVSSAKFSVVNSGEVGSLQCTADKMIAL
jgi:hypothetical protein